MYFSLILPIYNVEKYLKECVDSILAQTFNDYEVILVNDGSKDSSGAICDEYALKDNRVKVIHKENGGLSDARNVGTTFASGEYIIYIDSDDYVNDKYFLEKVKAANDGDFDIICYKFKKYFEKSGKFSENLFSVPNLKNCNSFAEKISCLVEKDAFYCSAWTKAIKRKLLIDNNIVFEKGLLGEDQEWYYHVLLAATDIIGIDEEFIVYRQRENSITSSTTIKNLKDCYYVVNKWYEKIKEADMDEASRIALLNSICKLYCNLLIAYTQIKDKKKKPYYKKIKQMSPLLKYHINPRAKLFYKIYNFLGFDILMAALKIICEIR